MALHGKNATLSVDGGEIVNLENYTLTRVGETAEVTSMGDTWAAILAGLTDFNATAEGQSQIGLDTTALLGSGGNAIFSTASTGTGYTGGTIISGITETAVVDDSIKISYTFEGNDTAGLIYGAGTAEAASGSSDTIHGKSIDVEQKVTDTDVSFVDIQGWSITMSVPVHDATVAHASNKGRTKIAGIPTATATVTTLSQTDDYVVENGDTLVGLKLWRAEVTAATGYYTGAAICTGVDPGFSTTGVETTTYSFVYTGVVDLATA